MNPSGDTNAIVIDNGTGSIKVGLSGDEAPRAVFPTVVGKQKMPGILVGLEQKEIYVGNEAKDRKGLLRFEYPIERGIIKDWDNMEKIWNYAICQEMKASPEEQPILLTEPPLNPKENRENMMKIMFETFNVPCVFIAVQTVLALYASGRYTGLIIDIGEGNTNIVPIYEGFAIPHVLPRLPYAGRDLTFYFQDLLRKQGYSLAAAGGYDGIRWLKEKICKVSLNYDEMISESSKRTKEEKKIEEKPIVLPDGNTIINVDLERYQVPEILFRPSLAGIEFEGIHKYAFDTIRACELEIQKELYKNIILAGGSTMFECMDERLKLEIAKLRATNSLSSDQTISEGKGSYPDLSVLATPERKYSPWIGGSIVSSLSTFSSMVITKNDYHDIGVDVVHRKCL